MDEMELYEVEDHIMAHQRTWIKNHYGQKQADIANYGWGIYEDDQLGPVVETKIYGPWKCISTTYRNGKYEDVVTDLSR
jgi:hypothetical protein